MGRSGRLAVCSNVMQVLSFFLSGWGRLWGVADEKRRNCEERHGVRSDSIAFDLYSSTPLR